MDMHIHSDFSGDARGSLEEFCQRAQEEGIKYLCFTEHLHFHPELGVMYLPFSLREYFQALDSAQKRFPSLHLYAGLEAGDPHLYKEGALERLIQAHDFDLILAGAHMFNGFFVGDEEYLKGKEISYIYTQYFQAVEKILAACNFDIVAHLDFPKRYVAGVKAYPMDLLEDLLKKIIHQGVGLEVNTAPLRKGCTEPCPGADILTLYRSLGGEIVTLGSDAHDPHEVGCGIAAGKQLLREVGLESHSIFKKRQGYLLPL